MKLRRPPLPFELPFHLPADWPRDAGLLAEFLAVLVASRSRGIESVVRYLRNPAPLLSAPLLRRFGATVAPGARIKGALTLDNVGREPGKELVNFRLGKNAYLGEDVFLDLANTIEIEEGAVIAGRVAILTHADCNRAPELARAFPRKCEPVQIGAGAWIGFGATILAGVRVAPRSVVAASAVCHHGTEEGFIFGGVPARKLASIFDGPRGVVENS